MNKSNDTHGWESLISGVAERVLVEQLFAVETGGFVLRGLNEAMGHMYDAGYVELDDSGRVG